MAEKEITTAKLIIPKVEHRVLKPVSKEEAYVCVQKLYDTAIISSSDYELFRKKINRVMITKEVKEVIVPTKKK